MAKTEDEYCGKIFLQNFPDEIILGKEIITSYMVLTKNGKAKHSMIEGQDPFKISLEFDFFIDGQTLFPQTVYPKYEDLYAHLSTKE